MSLSRKIADAVDAWTGGPDPVSAREGDHGLSLAVTASSPVGVALDHLDFDAGGPADRPIEAVRAWGERLADRVTYLMESLVVLEVDPDGGEVELRSRAPSARGGRKSYYEARLSCTGALRLHRVAFDSSDRRRQAVPFQLSREVLERLVDDLVDTAG